MRYNASAHGGIMLGLKFLRPIIVIVASLFSITLQAKSIECWNTYSRVGSKPVLTAQVLNYDKIKGINVSELAYKAYSNNPSLDRAVKGKEIVNTANHYKGKREFSLNRGAKLILPLKLSKADLENTNVGSARKSNGILLLPTKNKKNKEYTYLPMSCQERI